MGCCGCCCCCLLSLSLLIEPQQQTCCCLLLAATFSYIVAPVLCTLCVYTPQPPTEERLRIECIEDILPSQDQELAAGGGDVCVCVCVRYAFMALLQPSEIGVAPIVV